jgi:hypothetical protein
MLAEMIFGGRENISSMLDLTRTFGIGVAAAGVASVIASSVWQRRYKLNEQKHLLEKAVIEKTAELEKEIKILIENRAKVYAAAAAAEAAGLASVPKLPPPDLCEQPKRQIALRIAEASAAFRQAAKSAKLANRTANSLLIGQYVVGAAMTTSFVQKIFDPTYVGLFGLIVVITTALRQQFHADMRAQIASEKASQLEHLVRQSEDRVVVIETTSHDNLTAATKLLELLERISAEIARITSTSYGPMALKKQK